MKMIWIAFCLFYGAESYGSEASFGIHGKPEGLDLGDEGEVKYSLFIDVYAQGAIKLHSQIARTTSGNYGSTRILTRFIQFGLGKWSVGLQPGFMTGYSNVKVSEVELSSQYGGFGYFVTFQPSSSHHFDLSTATFTPWFTQRDTIDSFRLSYPRDPITFYAARFHFFRDKALNFLLETGIVDKVTARYEYKGFSHEDSHEALNFASVRLALALDSRRSIEVSYKSIQGSYDESLYTKITGVPLEYHLHEGVGLAMRLDF